MSFKKNNKENLINASYKLDKKYKHLIKYLEIDEIYNVPIRKDNFTGSGKELKCHWNVTALQRKYGGKVILGYHLYLNKKIKKSEGVEQLSIISHSCWLTPEGKLVDVTYGTQKDWCLETMGQQDDILFAPMIEYDSDKQDVILPFNFFVRRNYFKKQSLGVILAIKGTSMGGIQSDNETLVLFKEDFKTQFRKSNLLKYIQDENKDHPFPIDYCVSWTKDEYHLRKAEIENLFDTSLQVRKVA